MENLASRSSHSRLDHNSMPIPEAEAPLFFPRPRLHWFQRFHLPYNVNQGPSHHPARHDLTRTVSWSRAEGQGLERAGLKTVPAFRAEDFYVLAVERCVAVETVVTVEYVGPRLDEKW